MEENQFGQVDVLFTESIGIPGKRIFRILADSQSGFYATLWVEKEQVFALATTLKKIVLEKNRNEKFSEDLSEDNDRAETNKHIEFSVSQASISYEEEKDLFVFQFHGISEEDSSMQEDIGSLMLEFSIDRPLAEAFIEQSLNECASGRGTDSVSRNSLIVSGKVNPSTNGHFHK
tara:strand:- start:1045 stop:1569 length:525 start_codon:yes stop_codon:yes gene_type:complete